MRNKCDRCGKKIKVISPTLMMTKPKTDVTHTAHTFNICEECARSFFVWVGGGGK